MTHGAYGGRTLAAVQRATNTAAAGRIVDAALAGTGWSGAARRDGVRLEPPYAYWATYSVEAERAGRHGTDRRQLTLVGRATFTPAAWAELRDQLSAQYGGQACRPIEALGYPVLVDEAQTAWWFYPVDPSLPALTAATDPAVVRRLLAPRYSPKTPPARLRVEPVRYVPEISAAVRYRVVDRPGAAERVVYGKVYRGGRGREMHATMQHLWQASQGRPDLLSVVEPLTYDEDLGLHLEHAAPGREISGDRTDPRFLRGAVAAAEALAVLHDSDVPTQAVLALGPEIGRLEEVTEQMALVHPDGERLLRDLVKQLRKKVEKAPAEEQVVTHGDLKYDQFLEQDGVFTLVDFEEVGRAETSWDLGKWCAHAVPSMPESWEDSEAAERARQAFLHRYLELRPTATRGRFPLYEATHLANRAMVLMWGQTTGWSEAADSLLSLAVERLRTTAP